ncbi:MAG: lycopene cyclase domain-containing protein [candidate division FCPU426 bacterium]
MPQAAVSSTTSSVRKIPWYFITIITFFALPIIYLWRGLKKEDYPAFFQTVGLVMALGYAWSYLVSAMGWWTFAPECMLGIQVLPHLPLEEVLFYPLGGALSVLIYLKLKSLGRFSKRADLAAMLVLAGITALAMGLIIYVRVSRGHWAYYLISQLALFNALTLVLWWIPRARFLLGPATVGVLGMTCIGFFWNWLAFTQGWWAYHATLGWMFPPRVPIDDWNFFLFAPLAAISLYGCLRGKEPAS